MQDKQNDLLKRLNDEFTSKFIIYLKTDIANRDQLNESFKNILKKFNEINVVVNTAGIFDDRNVNLTLIINAVGRSKCLLFGVY